VLISSPFFTRRIDDYHEEIGRLEDTVYPPAMFGKLADERIYVFFKSSGSCYGT
jgi:hypothetical protein